MRTYTLLLSVMVHVCAIVAVYLSPLMASSALPEPRSRVQWTPVVAAQLPPPAAPAKRIAVAATGSTPLEAPVGVQPESSSGPSEPGVPGFDEGAGLVSGGGFFGGDVPGGVDVPRPAPPPPPPPSTPVRVGGVIEPPTKVVNVAPVYPRLAMQSGTQGNVILEALIGEGGDVREVRVLRSIPLLDAAAMEAVRQWRFTPTRLNGAPVPVLMTVTVAFRLDR